MEVDEVLVSINCTTYNQDQYIAQTIDSFLMQETDFQYEILVHDDASTDKTAAVIRQYEKKYPDLIQVIYQTNNQYSKGKRVWDINQKRAKGKYIAICEGDDFWLDLEKLQKQISFLETHSEASACVHAAIVVDAKHSKKTDEVQPKKENGYFTTEEVISGDGGLFATNSIVFRREYIENFPEFYHKAPVGDYPLLIHLALVGKVYYMKDFMSAYRIHVEGSWTEKNLTQKNQIKKHYQEINKMLDEVNLYTKGQYEKVIDRRKRKNEFVTLMLQEKYPAMRAQKYQEYFNELSSFTKMKIFFKQYFPYMFQVVKAIRLKFQRPVY